MFHLCTKSAQRRSANNADNIKIWRKQLSVATQCVILTTDKSLYQYNLSPPKKVAAPPVSFPTKTQKQVHPLPTLHYLRPPWVLLLPLHIFSPDAVSATCSSDSSVVAAPSLPQLPRFSPATYSDSHPGTTGHHFQCRLTPD
jgi:hypothetical protein